MNEWISVKDQLPPLRYSVIVAIYDDFGDTPWKYTTVGWMASEDIWIVDDDVCYGVTHWMHFPAPPENN